MATAKTTTLTFRIEPELKAALRTVAEREHRSIANTTAMDGGSADNAGEVVSEVAVLIMDHCERTGIPIPEVPAAANKRISSRKRG